MATIHVSIRPIELWSKDDLLYLRRSLAVDKVQTARLVSCIFWSMTKFQLEKINDMLVKVIEEVEQERLGKLPLFEVRKVIMEDGLLGPLYKQENKTPYVVAEVHTPVTEWTSATELLELEGLLKEMVVAIKSKAESNSTDILQPRTPGFQPTTEEIPGIIATIDREMEKAKKRNGNGLYDWIGCVRYIAAFTTIDQHRQYFRTVMGQIDSIDKNRVTLHRAVLLHNNGLERKRKAQEAFKAKSRRRERLNKI